MEYQAIETTGAQSACPAFTVSRETLLPILDMMARQVIERRASIPILSNIQIEASPNGELRITATDLDLELSATLPAEIERPGATTVSALTFRDIVKKADKGRDIRFDASDGRAKVSAGRAVQSIQTLPVGDYRTMAINPDWTLSAEFDAVQLADDIARVSVAISKEETRYYLNGISLTIESGLLCLAATDGHRLSLIERDAAAVIDTGFKGGIIPRKCIGVMQAILKARGAQSVSLHMSASKLVFDAGDIVLRSKLIDGTFPDYRRVIPNAGDLKGTLSVQSTELLQHCKAAQGQDGKIKTLKLEATGGAIMAGIAGPDGFARSLSAEYDGDDCGVAFNSTYMTAFASNNDALTLQTSAFDGDHISGAPILIKSPEAPQWTGVLMPVRCDADLPRPRAVTYADIKPAPGRAADLFGIEKFDAGRSGGSGKPKARVATEKECTAYLLDYAKRLGLPDLGNVRLVQGHDVPRGLTVGEIEQERTEYPETWSSMRRAYIKDYSQPTKIEARYADGAYSVPMPGRNQSPVTVQYADDDGEYGEAMPCTDAKGSIALPDQPKGRAKPKAKAKAAPVATDPIAQPETVATLSDECEPVAPKYKRGTVSRANLAIQMLSGIKPGLGRRAFDNCFEMGDGKEVTAVITGILKTDEAIARMVYYGKRSYRANYPGDYQETHYASSFMSPQWLAIIILHGIITLNNVTDTYGMRAKVAALLPDDSDGQDRESYTDNQDGNNYCSDNDEADPESPNEPQDDAQAAQVADESEIVPQDEKNGLGDDIDAQADPVAALIARMDALEAMLISATANEGVKINTPSVEIENVIPLPIDPRALAVAKARQEIALSVQSKPKRSPAHIRAIMAYLAMRKRRAILVTKVRQTIDASQAIEASLRECWERDKKASQSNYDLAMRYQADLRKEKAKRRRAVLKAREIMQRLCAEHKLVDRANDKRREAEQCVAALERKLESQIEESSYQERKKIAERERANAAERELASLKQKLADPTNPARESDLLMLRDNAQKWQARAEEAIAEGERLKQQALHYGGQIESLAVRLARAEAILRADAPALTLVPPHAIAA